MCPKQNKDEGETAILLTVVLADRKLWFRLVKCARNGYQTRFKLSVLATSFLGREFLSFFLSLSLSLSLTHTQCDYHVSNAWI